jgi:hypothetical protein
MVDRSGLRDELRRMLEDLEKEPAVDIFTIAPVDERAASESRLRDLWGPKVEVDRIEDLTFRSAGHSINVRLYRPGGATGTILFIHGGGWVVGSIETHDGSARALAHAASANVVSIGYRKGPEHPFPAAVIDVDAGLDWLLSNGEAMGIDTRRVAAPEWGDFKIVLALGRGGSVAAAGRLLEIDSSTVSRKLTAMEEALGAILVIRNGREFCLTAEGKEAFAAAEAIEGTIVRATAAIHAAKTHLEGGGQDHVRFDDHYYAVAISGLRQGSPSPARDPICSNQSSR